MMGWSKRPVYWIENRLLHVSVVFTWHLSVVRSQLIQRSFLWDRVIVGGPAISLMPHYFDDLGFVSVGQHSPGALQRHNSNATRTTAGCNNRCGFCGVAKINHGFRELLDWLDLPILVDDNLLACSPEHFSRVIDRLKSHPQCDFNQGLDSRLMTEYRAYLLAELPGAMIRLSLDNMDHADVWERALNMLRDAGIPKKRIRSYALVGYLDTPEFAWERCQWIRKHGIDPLPMWYHKLDAMEHNEITEQHGNFFHKEV